MGDPMTNRRTERRRHVRRPGANLGWLRAAHLRPGFEAVLADISSGGALVETPARLRPGLKAVLLLTTTGGELRASGEVLRAWVSAIPPDRGVLYRGALRFDRPMALPEGSTLDGAGKCNHVDISV